MRAALVVNPTSGKRRGDAIARHAADALTDSGWDVLEVRADTGRHARASLERLLDRSEIDRLVVVGGDGAVHPLLPVALDHQLPLAIVPAGTGNDVARHLGLDHPEAAIEALRSDKTREVDLIEISGPGMPTRHVATVVASGFDSKVNERADAMSWPRGNMRYNRAVLAELRSFQPLTFTITADGHEFQREAMLVAVANMPSFGGGLRIAEGAEDDDGELDVIVIHKVSKLKLIRVFPMLYQGTHIELPEVERIRAREVTWSSDGIVGYGDGERLGPLPLTARVLPQALRMVVGTS
jgi:diacylglycerol kinase (ATP)